MSYSARQQQQQQQDDWEIAEDSGMYDNAKHCDWEVEQQAWATDRAEAKARIQHERDLKKFREEPSTKPPSMAMAVDSHGRGTQGFDGPKLRILKRAPIGEGAMAMTGLREGRQSSGNSDDSEKGNYTDSLVETQSMKERERQYSEARARILGTSNDNSSHGNHVNIVSSVAKLPDNIIRIPKGPEGTSNGFSLRRTTTSH